MEVQVQVAGPITSKPIGNGTKFDIPLSNGTKPSTFDAALVTKISSFGTGFFTATIEEKPSKDGQRMFQNIVAAELGATAGTPLGGSVSPAGANLAPQATPIVPAAQNGSQGFGGMSPEREIKIVKQSSIASAANILGSWIESAKDGDTVSFDELGKWTIELAKVFFNEVMHPATAKPAAVAADPQAVAAFVAEQAGSPVVQVGTEGVAPASGDLPW